MGLEDEVQRISAVGEEDGLGEGGCQGRTASFSSQGNGERVSRVGEDAGLLAEGKIVRLDRVSGDGLGEVRDAGGRGCAPP